MNKFSLQKSIIFCIFVLAICLIYLFSSKFLDTRVNDIFTRTFNILFGKQSSDNVVLVVIDDKSASEIKWPWTRDLYSYIFDYFEKYTNAKAVVHQDLVVYPDTYYQNKDNIFYNHLPSFKKLISSYYLFNSSTAENILPTEFLGVFDSKSKVKIEDKRKNKLQHSFKGVVRLPKKYLDNVPNLASSQIPEGDDTIVRYYMPIVQFNGKFYPSLALSAFSKYTGMKKFELYDDFLCSIDDCQTLKLPIYVHTQQDYLTNKISGYYTPINWYKKYYNGYYSHKKYSAVDILASYDAIKKGAEPRIEPSEFDNKIVIFGLNADGYAWEQLSETPVMQYQADVDIHAVMLSNMLSNQFKTFKSFDYTPFITLLFSFFIIRGYRSTRYNLSFTSLLAIVYFVYYTFEYFMNVYVPPVTPIIVMYSSAIAKKLFEVVTADNKSEMMKRAMGKYMSKDVMKKVLSNLDKIKPGGSRELVTILFVDIRNFTKLSEQLPPQEVTLILNEYFSVIEPIIAKYHGIINKYMGDGVLAIFGEPINDENHAYNAIKCGSEIINCVKLLREKFEKEGKPVIHIGIGVNTGEVFAGNIGTNERLEYTVIGDNVNLAYRIEAYNQILKTQFLISQYTYEYVKDKVDVVKLSQVNIKGKSKPIDIYEILKINDVREIYR